MQTSHYSSQLNGSSAVARTDGADHLDSATSQRGVFYSDLEGQFGACNSEFVKMLGYSIAELIGRDFSVLFAQGPQANGKEREQLRKIILATMTGEGDYRGPLFAQPKNGASFGVEFSATLLRDSGSRPVAIVAVVTPVAKPVGNSAGIAGSNKTAAIISRRIDDTEFILASPVMHKFMGLVDRVASHTETVLITGETGTGKELIARTIHESSQSPQSSVGRHQLRRASRKSG